MPAADPKRASALTDELVALRRRRIRFVDRHVEGPLGVPQLRSLLAESGLGTTVRTADGVIALLRAALPLMGDPMDALAAEELLELPPTVDFDDADGRPPTFPGRPDDLAHERTQQRWRRTVLGELADALLVLEASGFRGPARASQVTTPRPAGPVVLPVVPSGFAGRDAAFARLDAAAPDRPAVVTGPPGVGKSALVVAWAHREAFRFSDGVTLVDLRGFSEGRPMTPPQAMEAALRDLGVVEAFTLDSPYALESLYRRTIATRRVLVVLDNARDSDQMRPLLAAGEGRVVLTSRVRPDALVIDPGIEAIPLEPLPSAEATGVVASVIGPDRATAERAAVEDLVRLCGGFPIALRIAAVNILGRDVPVQTVVDELRGDRTLAQLRSLDGERAVERVFDWSYDSLSKKGRSTFRQVAALPVFDIDPTTVQEVMPAGTIDQLDRLVRQHMVVRTPNGRFTFHDLLRLYGRERARREEKQEALNRVQIGVAQRLSRTASALTRDVLPTQLQTSTKLERRREQRRAWFALEQANVIEVILWGLDRSGPAPIRLLRDIGPYLSARGEWDLLVTLNERVVERRGELERPLRRELEYLRDDLRHWVDAGVALDTDRTLLHRIEALVGPRQTSQRNDQSGPSFSKWAQGALRTFRAIPRQPATLWRDHAKAELRNAIPANILERGSRRDVERLLMLRGALDALAREAPDAEKLTREYLAIADDIDRPSDQERSERIALRLTLGVRAIHAGDVVAGRAHLRAALDYLYPFSPLVDRINAFLATTEDS